MASIALAIGAASSIASSALGAGAASSAANTQANAEKQVAGLAQQAVSSAQTGLTGAVGTANSSLQNILGQEGAGNAGYQAAGQSGLNALQTALAPGGSLTNQFSFDPSQIANNPDYQFQLQQGTQAVNRAAAAQGTLKSGGTLKALTQYSQGLASNEIGQAYNQALNTFNTNRSAALGNLQLPLSLGQYGNSQQQNALQNYSQLFNANTVNSAVQSGNWGLQGTQLVGNALTGAANAQAAGTIGAANAWQHAIGPVTNALTSLATGGGDD